MEEFWLRMFENRVLWRIFIPKMVEMLRDWRNVQIEELQNFFCLLNITIKSRRRWAGNVARMGNKNAYKIWWGN
jgi:hypothetical protein